MATPETDWIIFVLFAAVIATLGILAYVCQVWKELSGYVISRRGKWLLFGSMGATQANLVVLMAVLVRFILEPGSGRHRLVDYFVDSPSGDVGILFACLCTMSLVCGFISYIRRQERPWLDPGRGSRASGH